jgi:hypothetical protein
VIVDPLSFPVLAGAALSQAFGFLFGRLAHVLDSRDEKTEDETEQLEVPPVVSGELGLVTAAPAVVEAHLPEIQELVGTISVYDRNPDRLDGQDAALRAALARSRSLLEQIYGKHITFDGEQRPVSGVRVEQRMKVVTSEVTGVMGNRIRSADVTQDVDEVRPGGSIIGVHGDDVG